MAFTSYIVDNDKKFERAIGRALATANDLRPAFALILFDFHNSQKAIFQLRKPGQYDDLTEKYKKAKQKKWGFVYPILKASGALEESTTKPKAPGSIATVRKRELIIGTRVVSKKGFPYAQVHQRGQKGVPRPRKILFIGPEAPRFAKGNLSGRAERWLAIMNAFVLKSLEKQGFDVGEVVVDPRSIPVKG